MLRLRAPHPLAILSAARATIPQPHNRLARISRLPTQKARPTVLSSGMLSKWGVIASTTKLSVRPSHLSVRSPLSFCSSPSPHPPSHLSFSRCCKRQQRASLLRLQRRFGPGPTLQLCYIPPDTLRNQRRPRRRNLVLQSLQHYPPRYRTRRTLLLSCSRTPRLGPRPVCVGHRSTSRISHS